MADLALKYGYGDWSDDDSDDDIWSNGRGGKKKRRMTSSPIEKNKRRRKRKRRLSSSYEAGIGGDGLTIGFEFGSHQKRTVKRRRTRIYRARLNSLGSKDNIKSGANIDTSFRRRSILSESQKDVRVRRPMERTILHSGSKDASKKMEILKGSKQQRFDSISSVRPPMHRTEEWTIKNKSKEE